jgi:hypothetical protein
MAWDFVLTACGLAQWKQPTRVTGDSEACRALMNDSSLHNFARPILIQLRESERTGRTVERLIRPVREV